MELPSQSRNIAFPDLMTLIGRMTLFICACQLLKDLMVAVINTWQRQSLESDPSLGLKKPIELFEVFLPIHPNRFLVSHSLTCFRFTSFVTLKTRIVVGNFLQRLILSILSRGEELIKEMVHNYNQFHTDHYFMIAVSVTLCSLFASAKSSHTTNKTLWVNRCVYDFNEHLVCSAHKSLHPLLITKRLLPHCHLRSRSKGCNIYRAAEFLISSGGSVQSRHSRSRNRCLRSALAMYYETSGKIHSIQSLSPLITTVAR